jgi:hypothetical protein
MRHYGEYAGDPVEKGMTHVMSQDVQFDFGGTPFSVEPVRYRVPANHRRVFEQPEHRLRLRKFFVEELLPTLFHVDSRMGSLLGWFPLFPEWQSIAETTVARSSRTRHMDETDWQWNLLVCCADTKQNGQLAEVFRCSWKDCSAVLGHKHRKRCPERPLGVRCLQQLSPELRSQLKNTFPDLERVYLEWMRRPSCCC